MPDFNGGGAYSQGSANYSLVTESNTPKAARDITLREKLEQVETNFHDYRHWSETAIKDLHSRLVDLERRVG